MAVFSTLVAIIAQRTHEWELPAGLRFGDSRGTGLSGIRWEGDDQRARSRVGLGTGSEHHRRTTPRSCCGWFEPVPGSSVAIDTTLVSALRADATPRPRAATTPSAALDDARTRKETTYPEIVGEGSRAKLVVLAAEVGGRWSAETAQFVGALAASKARSTPEIM